MTITPISADGLVIRLNCGIILHIYGDREILGIDTPDKEGQRFDFSLDVNGIKCDGVSLREAIDSYHLM